MGKLQISGDANDGASIKAKAVIATDFIALTPNQQSEKSDFGVRKNFQILMPASSSWQS